MASRSRPAIQGDIFDPAIAQARKDEAIEQAEDHKHRDLAKLREHLVYLYNLRLAGWKASDEHVYVTADDGRRFIRKNPGLRIVPGPWFGALFKAPGWKFTGKWVPSVIASNNGRMNRCWRYDG